MCVCVCVCVSNVCMYYVCVYIYTYIYIYIYIHTLLTECNSGTTKKLSFGVNTRIELNIWQLNPTLPSHFSVKTHPASCYCCRMFFSSVVELTPNGHFLDSATIAFSERHDGDLGLSVIEMRKILRMCAEHNVVCRNKMPTRCNRWYLLQICCI